MPQVLPANQPTEPTYDEKPLSRLSLIAALTPLSPLTARGELITVKGIEFVEEGNWSTATGWFDVSKSWYGDGLLCWAATSSNLIAWWKSQNPDYQKVGDPWGVDAVWDIYKNIFINDGGIISKGVEWWFDETGTGSTSAELQYKTGAVSSGGYYRDHLYGGVVEKNVTPANITTLRSASYHQATTLASTLVVGNSPGLQSYQGALEVHEAKLLYSIDDALSWRNYAKEGASGWNSGTYSTINMNSQSLTLDNPEFTFALGENILERSANTNDLASAIGRTFSAAAPDVPEPATGTLSLPALCGLMARRRRK